MRSLCIAVTLCLASPAFGQTTLKPDLAAVGFLVGHWKSDDGRVSDTGGTSKGSSIITVEANGEALLRRDHTDLFDAAGKATGGFDQIMLIYPEGGVLRADYSDGQHVIHYTGAVTPDSVTFTSTPSAGPVFKLTYTRKAPDTLGVAFGMVPPGGSFRPVANGTLRKADD